MNPRPGVSPLRKFVVLASRSLPKGYFLLGNERVYLVGRGAGCQILLLGDEVSRKHARIEGEGTAYSITDGGSTNGTLVNDHPVASGATRKLVPGDRITIGPHQIHFTVAEGTREEIAERFDGSSADTRRMAIMTKGKQATLAGVVDESTLLEVCQLIELNKHSGDLRVSSHGMRGVVRFREGVIVDAKCGVLGGDRAARQLIGFTSGDYAFETAPAGSPPQGPLGIAPTALTMDILRARDEAQAQRTKPAPPRSTGADGFIDELPPHMSRGDDEDTEVLARPKAAAPEPNANFGDQTRRMDRPNIPAPMPPMTPRPAPKPPGPATPGTGARRPPGPPPPRRGP